MVSVISGQRNSKPLNKKYESYLLILRLFEIFSIIDKLKCIFTIITKKRTLELETPSEVLAILMIYLIMLVFFTRKSKKTGWKQ